MNNSFLKFLIFILSFLPTKKNLILFGAMNGTYYGDNSRYLYEWFLKNRPEFKSVWMTRNHQVFKYLKERNQPVCLIKSNFGRWLQLRAGIAVYTNRLSDFSSICHKFPKRIKLIALRHGRSVKRVRFARLEHSLSPREESERKIESRMIYKSISTSEFISDIQETCLQIGREKHIVTGYPRNDYLLKPTQEMNLQWAKFVGKNSFKRIILYGPSWRHGRCATQFFPFDDFKQERLFSFLHETNALLLLRPHNNDLRQYPKQKEFLSKLSALCPNIRMATHQILPDINEMLPYIDILVSDYSALYHDFLLLDRPIVLIPYDYEEFARFNGFLYNYKKLAPGPIVGNMEQWIHAIRESIVFPEKWFQQRRKLLDLVHLHQDNNSCERVARVIDDALKNFT